MEYKFMYIQYIVYVFKEIHIFFKHFKVKFDIPIWGISDQWSIGELFLHVLL